MADDRLDLGDGHQIIFATYDGEVAGGNVMHAPVEGKCGGNGWVSFEGRKWHNGFNAGTTPGWKVESDNPLTLSPSILCRACGDHGFIRNGKWERA